MPAYDYRCPAGHVTQLVQSILDPLPATVACGEADTETDCTAGPAARIFEAPAAIHFHGRGFYATDVKGSQERRRRPNAGDSLHRIHDANAAALARSL